MGERPQIQGPGASHRANVEQSVIVVAVTARKLAVRQRARYLRLATTAWHRLPPVVAVAGLRVLGLSLCLQEAAGSHVQCEDQVAARAVGLS